jgi:branched-chain amino acid transport system permease protein
MVYGILKFINFAHSDVFALGSWVSYKWALLVAMIAGWTILGEGAEVPPLWGGALVLLLAMATCGAVGYTIQRLAYKPLRGAPRLNVLITAIGVSLFLQNAGQLQFNFSEGFSFPFGTRPARMPALLSDRVVADLSFGKTLSEGTVPAGWSAGSVRLDRAVTLAEGIRYQVKVIAADGTRRVAGVQAGAGEHPAGSELLVSPPFTVTPSPSDRYVFREDASVLIRLVDVLGTGTAIVLMLLLEYLVFRTKLGRAMRAVSFDTKVASLMGIPVDRVISFTFVLGSTLAAAAGFLYALKYPGLNQTAAAVWVLLGLKAFVAAVIGGIGNVRGAMLGGFFIGMVELFGGAYISTSLRDVYVFSLLILVLLVRPGGILGSAVAEKV